MKIDDARLDPIWETAAELDWPVMIHVADPVAFFDPLDETNERWEELHAHPDWQFPSPPFPSFMSIMNGLARLVERHPRTTFIGAHVGCYAENLALGRRAARSVSQLLRGHRRPHWRVGSSTVLRAALLHDITPIGFSSASMPAPISRRIG